MANHFAAAERDSAVCNLVAKCVTNCIDQQTTKPDNDYIPLRQCLWTFDATSCPPLETECFLLHPVVCRTVFHRTSLLSPLSPSSAVVSNRISSHFLILLPDFSLICTFPMQWLVILDTTIIITLQSKLLWHVLGALVNSARSHQTALHMAALKQHDGVVRLLVDFGADVYLENKHGLRPSALVPVHLPLHDFLCHCESMLQNTLINFA